jgi:two-component system sensor kinase FixL
LKHSNSKRGHDGFCNEEQTSLRTNAESQLVHTSPATPSVRSAEELLHELQMHQIELEMQNEELRRAQVVLEESRDRYVDFYDFAPAGYITLGSNATIADINFAGARLLGMDRNKLWNKRFASFVAPQDHDLWYQHFLAVKQHDSKLACELRILRNDGAPLFVHLDSIRLIKVDKEIVVRIALTDISELKRAEIALQESEAQRRMLEHWEVLRASLDGFWTVDATNGRILEVNERYCSMMGYSQEELLGMSIPGLEAIETPEEIAVHVKKVLKIGYDRFETRQRHKQGHLVDIEISVIHSEVNSKMNYVFLRDITERKRNDEALKRSQTQLKTFIQQAPICIAMLERDMNYLAVSGRWVAEYGRGHNNLIGLNHYKVLPDLSAEQKANHLQVLGGAAMENEDDLWIWNDGSKHRVSWAMRPWIDENEKIGGIIIYAEDITAQKDLETEILLRRADMEQLQKLQVAAQTTAAIAHELNQPLQAIALHSEAALLLSQAEKPDLEKIRTTLEKCERQALRAGQSIHEMLDFLGRRDYPVEDFDLNDEILKILDIAISEHELRFHSVLSSEDGMPQVRVNRTHLHKVLMNLLHNSLDAMQEVGVPLPAITVTVTSKMDEHVAHVIIQDNGPGIKEEDMRRVFEPFFTTKAKGIGMGLAISRSLIEENGGQLWVDPQANAGATFHLTLPFTT